MSQDLNKPAGPIVLPAHYGGLGNPWPEGFFWLIEAAREGAPTLFWMDRCDDQGRTGWAYSPDQAAGFRSEAEAWLAYEERGRLAVEGCRIYAAEHEWVA